MGSIRPAATLMGLRAAARAAEEAKPCRNSVRKESQGDTRCHSIRHAQTEAWLAQREIKGAT